MDKELTKVQDNDHRKSLADLATELLVIIMSYLPARDKINMRYVCRRFKDVSETRLLWKEFVWPDCEPRHVRIMSDVLKVYGDHVRRLLFPAHVTPVSILEMAHCCTKVTHLSLPKNTQLSLDHLEDIVHTMTQLQELDMFTNHNFIADRYGRVLSYFHEGKFIEGLLEVTATSVKKLKLRIDADNYHPNQPKYILESIQKWAIQGNPLPPVINILTEEYNSKAALLFQLWSTASSKLSSFEIGWYDIRKVPMNLYPSMPLRNFKFGPTATLPFVKLSDHGIMGLKHDTFYLSDYDHHGEVRQTLNPEVKKEEHFLNCIDRLHSVSYVNFSRMDIHHDHLEQLAFACPNLQRLNIAGNKNCLKDLQGLHAIVQTCKNLEGLNLGGISVSLVESCLCLWELLSRVKKLTHLVVNLCVLKPYDMSMLEHCCSLQALEIHSTVYGLRGNYCVECLSITHLLFSHFPLLLSLRMINFPFLGLKCALNNCRQLKYLYEYGYRKALLPFSNNNSPLLQLCITTPYDVTGELIAVLSAHRGLECVILSVRSITISGIITLINNSPNLMLLDISITVPLINEPEYVRRIKQVRYADYTDRVLKMFPYRETFSVGNFKVCYDDRSNARDKDAVLFNTDLNSLWVQ